MNVAVADSDIPELGLRNKSDGDVSAVVDANKSCECKFHGFAGHAESHSQPVAHTGPSCPTSLPDFICRGDAHGVAAADSLPPLCDDADGGDGGRDFDRQIVSSLLGVSVSTADNARVVLCDGGGTQGAAAVVGGAGAADAATANPGGCLTYCRFGPQTR